MPPTKHNYISEKKNVDFNSRRVIYFMDIDVYKKCFKDLYQNTILIFFF